MIIFQIVAALNSLSNMLLSVYFIELISMILLLILSLKEQ